MGSSRNKMLNQQEELARQRANAAFEAGNKPTEAEQIMSARTKKFLDWYDTAGKDVTQAPGLSPYLQIGKAAQERASRQRMGLGAMQLGAGNEGYAQKLREQYSQEAAQNFGSGLEQAVAGKYAEATGNLMPLINVGEGRLGRQQSAAMGRENMYMNAPRETPFWKQLTMAGIQGAMGIASAGLGSGGRWSGNG